MTAFMIHALGRLKVFNSAKDFGFISPVFHAPGAEAVQLKLESDDGIWFFGNHSLPLTTKPGVLLAFEVWENAEGKPQARSVQLAAEQPEEDSHEVDLVPQRHSRDSRVIYPSVYISDVPVEYTEEALRELHKNLGLNPKTIMGLKFLPFTEASLASAGAEARQVAPVTGSVILRYCNEAAANAACERLKGHPVQTSNGTTKFLGARHAAPAKWMTARKAQEDRDRKQLARQGDVLCLGTFGCGAASPAARRGDATAAAPSRRPLQLTNRVRKDSLVVHEQPLALQWSEAELQQRCEWWWPGDPYYKTQPCPYQRQSVCQMGQGCYFAHSPEELRATPGAMMMNQWAQMMMGQAPKKAKKEKRAKDKGGRGKEAKEKQGRRREASSSSRGSQQTASNSTSQSDPRSCSPSAQREKRQRRIELDDEDF